MENFKEFFGLRPPVNVTREALRERLIRCTSEVSASLQRVLTARLTAAAAGGVMRGPSSALVCYRCVDKACSFAPACWSSSKHSCITSKAVVREAVQCVAAWCVLEWWPGNLSDTRVCCRPRVVVTEELPATAGSEQPQLSQQQQQEQLMRAMLIAQAQQRRPGFAGGHGHSHGGGGGGGGHGHSHGGQPCHGH